MLSRIPQFSDYDLLPGQAAERARRAVMTIHPLISRTLDGIIRIGAELADVREALPHGHWERWLEQEFAWSDRTARNYMAVALRLADAKPEIISVLTPTAAYLLAAPRTPDELVDAVMDGVVEPTEEAIREAIAADRPKGGRPQGSRAPDRPALAVAELAVIIQEGNPVPTAQIMQLVADDLQLYDRSSVEQAATAWQEWANALNKGVWLFRRTIDSEAQAE